MDYWNTLNIYYELLDTFIPPSLLFQYNEVTVESKYWAFLTRLCENATTRLETVSGCHYFWKDFCRTSKIEIHSSCNRLFFNIHYYNTNPEKTLMLWLHFQRQQLGNIMEIKRKKCYFFSLVSTYITKKITDYLQPS